jgi:hypothetical protein
MRCIDTTNDCLWPECDNRLVSATMTAIGCGFNRSTHPPSKWETIRRSYSPKTMRRLSTISRKMILLLLATSATVLAGCNQTPAEGSFGVEGTTLSCEDDRCDIVFFVDNQFRHSVEIRYRAVLSNVREGAFFELSDQIELPALKKTRVSRTVSVIEQPDRLQVTVTTLQDL